MSYRFGGAAGKKASGLKSLRCSWRKAAAGWRTPKLLFGREELFVDGGYYDVVGVDHFGEVEAADFGEEFVCVEFGEGVVAVNPGDEFGDGDADGIVNRAIDAGGHEFVLVFEARPVGGLPFHEFEAEFCFHGDFDGAPGNFAIAHGGMSITEIEERAFDVDGEIESVAGRDFGCVHVATEFGRDDGAAGFTMSGSDTDATEERFERKLRFEIGVESLESDELFVGVDGVIPGALGKRHFLEHGRVVRGIGGAKTGAEGADALVAVDLKIEDVDDEGVAGLGAVDEERTGERIVDLDVGERITGLLESVAETIEGIGFEDVARLEMGDGLGSAEGGFDVVHGGVEADDVSSVIGSLRGSVGQENKGCD
jgi:hypothetical protein